MWSPKKYIHVQQRGFHLYKIASISFGVGVDVFCGNDADDVCGCARACVCDGGWVLVPTKVMELAKSRTESGDS